MRGVLIACAILLLWPLPIWVHVVGIAFFAALFVYSRSQGARLNMQPNIP
jgi:hypothetical protein